MDMLCKKQIFRRVREERNVLRTIRRRKAKWIGHTLRRNCVLIDSIEGEVERRDDKMRNKIYNDGNGKRGYLKFEIGSNKLQFGENCH